MSSEVQIPNPDQLHDYSVLSMFPQTFKQPSNDALKSNDLNSIHDFMKSMALKNHDRLFEQAKSILAGSSENMEMNFQSITAPESKKETVAAKSTRNPQERRPGLDRKRARFSIRPETSQRTTSLEPSFDIDKYQNPEEFFAAYEKFENAKKELQRQRGDGTVEVAKSPVNARRRSHRPEIPRKKVTYKHHRYSGCPEDDIFSSQEASQHGIPNPSNDESQHDITFTSPDLQEKVSADSVSKTENRVNELFDELMSSQIESLNEENVVSFLQDRLQIKPFELENLCLPDFHDVSKTDVDSLEEKAPKARKAFSDIRNIRGGLRIETPVKNKQLVGSPIQPGASPTPPKNPFASLSQLRKQISQSMRSSDPFSSDNIDSYPVTSPPVKILNGATTVGNDPHEVPMGDSTSGFMDYSPREHGASVGIRGRDSHSELNVDDQCNRIDSRDMDDNICGPDVETNVQTCQLNAAEVNAQCVLQEVPPSVQIDVNMEESSDMDIQPYGAHKIDGNAKDVQQKASSSVLPGSNVELSEIEPLDGDGSLLGQENPSDSVDHAEVRLADVPESGPCQQNEAKDMQQKASSSVLPGSNVESSEFERLDGDESLLGQENPSDSVDHAEVRPAEVPESGTCEQNEEHERVSRKGRGRAPRQVSQRKAISRRQSLAEAGTVWESGVRRSSRVKHRPLEYWKGERQLFGRVHNSLRTVIGLKYISPTSCTFKVKSYVSDKYKNLVKSAALH